MEESIGLKILKHRRLKGIDQNELAEKCGLDQSAISMYERGKRKPTKSNLRKIANVLGEDVSVFNIDDNSLISQIIENTDSMTDDELRELKEFSAYIIWKRNKL